MTHWLNVTHLEALLILKHDVIVWSCGHVWMLVNLACAPASYSPPTNFSPFPFFVPTLLQQTTADTDMCDITFAVSYSLSLSLSLSESLSESALIRSFSPPITQNQEKHTPTRDWGSDKIKHTRRLIWITGARSIRIVRDSEPDRETETTG